jgi:hypothetical protein
MYSLHSLLLSIKGQLPRCIVYINTVSALAPPILPTNLDGYSAILHLPTPNRNKKQDIQNKRWWNVWKRWGVLVLYNNLEHWGKSVQGVRVHGWVWKQQLAFTPSSSVSIKESHPDLFVHRRKIVIFYR